MHVRDRAVNVSIIPCEFPENFRQMSKEWNTGTAQWLKNYVYDRLAPPKGRVPFYVTLATYVTSALWHGIFPGYFFFFLFAAFGDNLARCTYIVCVCVCVCERMCVHACEHVCE
jgi:lysophospholipid acyltransferase